MESFGVAGLDDESVIEFMKLVIVYTPVFEYALGNPKRIGGAERQQWLLARALVKSGWEVTVGVREGLQYRERMVIDGVNFVGMGMGQFIWSCYRFLISERPDWWYWRAAEHLLGPAVQIAKLVGVATIFAVAFDTDIEPRRALARRPGLWPLYSWGLSGVDKIFVQHGGQMARLAKRWQAKAFVVPSLAAVLPNGPPHAERKGYVSWVGTLRQPKRADLLVEIAKRLPNVDFVVCGGTHNWRSSLGYGQKIVDSLQELPNVKYLGQVDTQETQRIIAEANLLLSTSDGEGFPNTFLEAWSSRTPVISLTIDPDDAIHKNGLGAVTGNLEGAIAAIKNFMNSSSLRDDMGDRARQYVHLYHGESRIIDIIESSIRYVRK